MEAPEAVQGPERLAVFLGRRMRKLRERQQLSQEKLAQRVGMSKETVRRVEAGLETTTTTMDRLLWAMGVDAEELLATPSKLGAKAGRRSTSPEQPIQAPLVLAHGGR